MNVGDKVRVVRELTDAPQDALAPLGVSVGDAGDVVEIDSDYGRRPVMVVFTGSKYNPVGFSEDELEVVS